MPVIRPSSDLRNNYNEISTICHQTKKPVYITKNGAGDLAVMSIELYEFLTDKYELYKELEKGDIPQNIRKFIVDNYIIFYRIKDINIQIVRILYKRRNWIDLL